MSQTPWDWDYLIHKHFSGELTEEQRVALNDRLRKFPRLRKRFAELAFEQAQMRDLMAVSEPVPILILPPDAREPVAQPLLKPVPVPPAASLRRPWILPTLAAAACLAITIGIAFWSSRGPVTPYKLIAGDVRVEGAKVEVVGAAPASFRMTDGSEAQLAPSTSAVFLGRQGDARQVVQISQGAGTFKVAKAPDSFRVDTPSGRVAVLGTQFSVELRKQKRGPAALFVSVASGRVRVDAAGTSRELGAGESRLFGAEVEEKKEEKRPEEKRSEKKEPRPVFNGVVHGKVVVKGDAHLLLAVDRVVSLRKDASEEIAATLPGRTLKVSVSGTRRKDQEPQPDKIQMLFVRKVELGQELSLDVRQIKGDEFTIGALDEEQAAWAVKDLRREENQKKKLRDPEKSPDRPDKRDDK